MLYNRWWFNKDLLRHSRLAVARSTIRAAIWCCCPQSTARPQRLERRTLRRIPGDPYKAWDTSATFDYMPSQYITFRWEYNYRAANVPYFSGHGGVTPPGGNNGNPGALVCLPGVASCSGSPANTWYPDLARTESRLNFALLVKF